MFNVPVWATTGVKATHNARLSTIKGVVRLQLKIRQCFRLVSSLPKVVLVVVGEIAKPTKFASKCHTIAIMYSKSSYLLDTMAMLKLKQETK